MELAKLIMMGMTLGPLFAGFMYDWQGHYQTAFIALAVLVGLGSGAFLSARKPAPTEPERSAA